MATEAAVAAGLQGGAQIGTTVGQIGFGIYDRVHEAEREKIEDTRYIQQLKYQMMMDKQAQANWEAQMAFQQAQSDIQQQQFAANRIGNLAKEYKEAGLNPALAAGMGASTAGVVGTGGSASRGTLPSKDAGRVQKQAIQQANWNFLQQKFQIEMQKDLNDAQVDKLNAEARLARTQADDIEQTRETRIEKMQSEIGLNERQAETAVKLANKLATEEKYTKALENLANADLTAKQMENDLKKIRHDLIESMPENYRQAILAEMKNTKFQQDLQNKMLEFDQKLKSAEFARATVLQREQLIKEWWDSTIGLFIKASSGGLQATF